MKILRTRKELSEWRDSLPNQATIGFVPTMGALHEGHISLVKRARQENNWVIASIFVNPLQFNQPADFDAYPHTLEADRKLLEQVGCDVVFVPSVLEMYPNAVVPTTIQFGALEQVLEGAQRPGHFSGVGVVVSRLFHWVKPGKAYFGLKDLQQVRVIQQMVTDLGFDIQIIPCQTTRAADGLALSSRNTRLSLQGRALAPALFEAMSAAASLIPDPEQMKIAGLKHLSQFPEIDVAYFEVVDSQNLQRLESGHAAKEIAIVAAIWLEGVRLIDNLILPL